MHNRVDYRIRNSKRTEEDLDMDFEEHLKLSPHINRPKRQSSAALTRKHNESNQNSRLKQSRTGSGFVSNVGSRVGRVLRMSKSSKDQNVVTDIEFNNVRWISIVSAYDSKRLRHVTVSKQSCENFLKKYGQGIKNDPAAMAYLRDIKKHFQSWLSKINQAFVVVLDLFLSNGDRSPLVSLEKVGPILQQIRSDTAMMQEKLVSCLKIYENSDFRKLSEKFKGFFKFSSSLQELIALIFQKKERIDNLFYELQNDKKVDKMIEKIKKEGIKQTKKLVQQSKYNRNLCDKIMEKVSFAINDMATRSLTNFHKLQDAKELILRIQKILSNANKQPMSIKQIRKLSQIFHQVLEETNKFQDFVEKFDSQSDYVSAELRQKIHQCKQNLLQKKKLVAEMQAAFVGTVISQTITLLHHNHSLNNAFREKQAEYHQYNHLLQAIADAMLDQTKRTITQGLVKQNRISFARLQQDLQKVRRSFRKNEEGIIIDTENGQVAAMQCCKLAKDYKEKVKNLIKKHDEALRNLNAKPKDIKLLSPDKDLELIFLTKLTAISQAVNSRQRNNKFIQQRGFHELKEGLAGSAAEVQKTHIILQELQQSKVKITELNRQNPLKQLIKIIRTQNSLYQQCSYLLNFFKLVSETSQKNLIQSLAKIAELSSNKKKQLEQEVFYKQTKACRYIIQRLYCLALVKGLKKNVIKQLDDSKLITFPENQFQLKQMENQSKYKNLILNNLGQEAIIAKQKLKKSLDIMKDFVSAKKLVEKLKANQNGQYTALVLELSTFSSQMFKVCLLNEKTEGISTQVRRIALELGKCLKLKSSNIDILEREIDLQTNEALLRVRKDIIYYKNLNDNALNACEKITKDQNSDPLQTLSQITHIISQYLNETKQKVYLALNQFKQPIWVGTLQQAKQGITRQINLKGYPRGNLVDQYIHEAAKAYDVKNKPVLSTKKLQAQQDVVKNLQNSPGKIILKQKSHPRDAMDEQIQAIQSDKDMKQQMGEDINVVQDMDEQINEQQIGVEDQMAEQIGDQMDIEINEIDMQENLDQDIVVSDIQITKPKSLVVNKPQQAPPKIQKNVQPVKQIEQLSSVYEIIPFFRELQQIRQLFQKINTSEKLFWKEYVDFQEIQDYYHREENLKDRNNFVKSLENSYSSFLGNKFGSKLGEIVKNLEKLRPIKGLILSLGQKNWQQLFKILEIVQRNYSVLYSNKNEILHIFTYNGDNLEFRKHSCKKCVENFLQARLKTSFFSLQSFNLEGYIANCFKVETQQLINADGISFHYIVKYTAKGVEALPTSDIDQKLKGLKQIQTKFQKQLNTGINIGYCSLQFWVKALESKSQDCYKPDYSVLDGYVKQLTRLQKKDWICHYIVDYCQQMAGLKTRVKSHKNAVQNYFFKVDSSNVLQCLEQLSNLYKSVPMTKLYYQSKQEKMLLYCSRSQNQGILNQTPIVLFIEQLFRNKLKADSQTKISKDQIIAFFQKTFKQQNKYNQSQKQFMNLLIILKIQHYFMRQPQFLLKNSLENLVFSCLKNLQVKKTTQLSYQELFHDIFQYKTSAYSQQLKLKAKISEAMLSTQSIQNNKQLLKTLTKQIIDQKANFRSIMKKNDFSNVFYDLLVGKFSQNNLFIYVSAYYKKLKDIKEKTEGYLNNKEKNLLIYINNYKAQVQKLQKQTNQLLGETNDLAHQISKSGKSTQKLIQTDRIFRQLIKWVKSVSLSTDFTSYALLNNEKPQIFNLQLDAFKNDDKVKSFLTGTLRKNWLKEGKWDNIWDYIYEKYVQKYVKIQKISQGFTQIIYDIQNPIKDIIQDIRLDLADKEDVIQFTKMANKLRVTKANYKNDTLVKSHTKIIARLNFKKRLLQLKETVLSYNFIGISESSIFKSFVQSLKVELDIVQSSLSEIITLTKSINRKDADLSQLKNWYKIFAHDKLGCNYFELKSSTGIPISILPFLKTQKDNSKNKEQIQRLLAELDIHFKYRIKLENGQQTIYLQPQAIHCSIQDKDGFLTDKTSIQNFQPQLAEGQMLIFVIQQTNNEQIPLWISCEQIIASVVVNISQNKVTADLSCGIWRIAKQDYESIKSKSMASKSEQNVAIRKKIRGLASPQQKFKDVKIGEKVNFVQVGEWLKTQIQNYRRKKQQKQRAEIQRQRQIQLLRKESQAFLTSIYAQLQKENIPVYMLSLKQIQEKKQQIQQNEPENITGYYKLTSQKTCKIIEKLEQTKSTEEISRLNSLTKVYMKALDQKLIQNYVIESKVILKAKEEFAKVESERETKRKQKEQEKKLKKESKNQKLKERIKKLQQALKQKQPSTVQNPPNTLNTLNVANSIQQQKVSEVIQEESISKKSEEPKAENLDVIELIMQLPKLKGKKIQNFLIEWLQYQQPKDADYYRCLLKEFSKLSARQIDSLIELK